MSMLIGLRREQERLLQELEGIPAYRQLRAIQSAIQAYEQTNSTEGVPLASKPRAQISETRKAIREVCYAYLDGQTEPVKSAALVPYLETQGLTLGSGDRVSKLSSLLAQDARFRSLGRRGWRRATAEEREVHRHTASEPDTRIEEDDPS